MTTHPASARTTAQEIHDTLARMMRECPALVHPFSKDDAQTKHCICRGTGEVLMFGGLGEECPCLAAIRRVQVSGLCANCSAVRKHHDKSCYFCEGTGRVPKEANLALLLDGLSDEHRVYVLERLAIEGEKNRNHLLIGYQAALKAVETKARV